MMNARHAPQTTGGARPCAGKCNPDRSDFLRATALAAFASILGAGIPMPASAKVGTISPSRTKGGTLFYPLPSNESVLIDESNDVVITRVDRSVYAFSLACPHRSTVTLRWEAAEGIFLCPKHEAEFRPNGELVRGKPARSMDRYAVRRDGANLAVDTNTIYEEDLDAQWAKALVST
jgi:nitrite reductase/ring-hydroxylating ferredoxin subunit